MYITESNPAIDNLVIPFKKVFGEYDIEFNEDIIYFTNSSDFLSSIEIDNEELLAELEFQKHQGIYYTITESSLRVILFDRLNKVDSFLDEDIEKTLTDNRRGISISIKNAKELSLLTLNSVELIYNGMPLEANQTYNIENFIDDKFVICEIKFEGHIGYEKVIEEVEDYIDSLIAHISFQKDILLEKPIDLGVSFEINTSADTNDFLFSIINQKEPLNYFISAEKATHIHLKFLEYYHVIEYYFYQRRILEMEEMLESLVNKKLLNSNVNHSTYYENLNKVWDSYYKVKNGKLNEEDELKYIFNKHIGFDLIANMLQQIPDFEQILKKAFCDIKGTVVDIDKVSKKISGVRVFNEVVNSDEKTKFCNEMATRIYKIRNFIVHSKKFGNDVLFIASQEQLQALARELLIIRSIAYIMLNRVF